MADFGRRAAGFDSAAGVAVEGAFKLAADRDAEFDEGASFGIDGAGFGGGVAEGVVSGENFRVIFLEFEEAAGEFSGRTQRVASHSGRITDVLRFRRIVIASISAESSL